MIWWGWSKAQRLGLVTAMLAMAATPWIMLGWLPNDWGAFAGGTAFLIIPQIAAWNLFVGFWTGRMASRFGSEYRSTSPTWFWATAAIYACLLLLFLWFVLAVVTGGLLPRI